MGVRGYSDSTQRVTTVLRPGKRVATYTVRVTNRGDVAESMVLRGAAASKAFAVTYVVGGKNVTKALLAGTFRTSSLSLERLTSGASAASSPIC